MVQESEHFSAPVTSPSRSRRLTAYLQAACQLATTHTRLISPAIVFQRGPKRHAVHQYLELDVVPAPPGVPRRTTPDARCNNRATPTSQQSCVARGQSSHDWRSSHPSFGSTVAPQTNEKAQPQASDHSGSYDGQAHLQWHPDNTMLTACTRVPKRSVLQMASTVAAPAHF